MEQNKKEIIKIYTLIKGIYQGIKESNYELVDESTYEQYNSLINVIYKITSDDYFKMLMIGLEDTDEYGGESKCAKYLFLTKIIPAKDYINDIYIDTKEEIIQKVGALYNSIEDTQLQKRCGDILLEASGAFDRVINQATQVLEDRIKKKAGLEKTNLIGLPLVSKAIHSKLEHTILKFNENPDIQEHYASLFKGIIGVYRNSTHHGLEYECSREEALKFCSYIDLLLKEVDKSEKII
ncbi:MAG: hypothetical protein J6A15_06470 [Clostridia bacterium]|nr:hypothetical protein [Clostridia bacterium]